MSKHKSVLDVLFDSKARVKILKFIFRNTEPSFTAEEIAVRVQESRQLVSKEINNFLEIGLLKLKK